MRILMLAPRWPYPPDRGDTLRSWHVLQALADRHEVWLAAVDRVAPTLANRAPVERLCRQAAALPMSGAAALARGVGSLLGGHSLTAGYFGDARLPRLIDRWQRDVRFDVLWTYSSAMAPAAVAVDAPRRIVDLGDVDSAKWALYAARNLPPKRWLYLLEAARVAALEAHAVATHDFCLLVNERERHKLLARLPNACTGVLPTVVDLAEYADLPAVPPTEPVIGMIGSMFYPPNVRAAHWFGRWVWPLVQREVPAAQWWIVGSRPTRAVRRWAAEPGVTVTGYVPDVRPYLAATRVLVNAVEGDLGVQSKLVVGMAAGRPAVVTPDAAAGIDCDDPPPFRIARSAPAFADAVVQLLRDDAAARRLAIRARAVAEANYGVAGQARRIAAFLRDPACTPPGPVSKPALETGAEHALTAAGPEVARR